MELHDVAPASLPAIFLEDGTLLRDPSLSELGQSLGMSPRASEQVYDVAIIGAGPAGLAASVYGASEGLETLLIEKRAPGGQAGTSSRIENYLGFPKGLSGSELARRAITQSTRFGTEFLSPQEVVGMEIKEPYKILELSDGEKVNCRSVVVACGVNYRKLPSKGVSDFTGAGIYYGAATTEASACKGKDIYIVGGGNSAGQGAVYLANFARNVYILIRRESLASSMSQYLIDQIDGIENITLLPQTEVVEALGDHYLERLKLIDNATEEVREVDAGALFIFIGARPYTDWLPDEILKDKKGFVLTGRDLATQSGDIFRSRWNLEREPYFLETSVPGVFAAGDVRSGAMNRVAAAVGEGSTSIKLVHQYLAGG